jgi:hypothetical protein
MPKKSWRKGKGRSSTKAQLIVRVFRTSSSPNEITSWNTSSFHRNECFWEKKILKRAKNFKKNLRPRGRALVVKIFNKKKNCNETFENFHVAILSWQFFLQPHTTK